LTERIADLSLEHAAPAGRSRSRSVLFVHGMVVGAEQDRITPAALQRQIAARYRAEYQEAAGHAHMLMLEEGWEQPFKDMLAWMERAVHER
jgi:hypothetical protein